jgi:hypothetical protein
VDDLWAATEGMTVEGDTVGMDVWSTSRKALISSIQGKHGTRGDSSTVAGGASLRSLLCCLACAGPWACRPGGAAERLAQADIARLEATAASLPSALAIH